MKLTQTTIVTHGGNAHRDEFLACCCILWHEYSVNHSTCIIERRLVGAMDLERDDVWVVDTGGRFQPERRNFDHHSEDQRQECAFSLVFRFLWPELYAPFAAVSPWLRVTNIHDCLGPLAAAKDLNVDRYQYMALRSPVERHILALFAERPIIHSDSLISQLMLEVGRTISADAREVAVDVPSMLLRSASNPYTIAGNVRAWDLRGVDIDFTTAAKGAINHAAAQRAVDVVVSPASSGGHVTIYRQHRAEHKIDMSGASELPGVKFAHPSGFLVTMQPDSNDGMISAVLTEGVRKAMQKERDAASTCVS